MPLGESHEYYFIFLLSTFFTRAKFPGAFEKHAKLFLYLIFLSIVFTNKVIRSELELRESCKESFIKSSIFDVTTTLGKDELFISFKLSFVTEKSIFRLWLNFTPAFNSVFILLILLVVFILNDTSSIRNKNFLCFPCDFFM